MFGSTGNSSAPKTPIWAQAGNQFPPSNMEALLATNGPIIDRNSSDWGTPNVRMPREAPRKQPVVSGVAEHIRLMKIFDFSLADFHGAQGVVLSTVTEQVRLMHEEAPATPIEVARRKIKEIQQKSKELSMRAHDSDPLVQEATQVIQQDKKMADKVNPAIMILRHIGKAVRINLSDATHVIQATHSERKKRIETQSSLPRGKQSQKGMLGMSPKKRAAQTASQYHGEKSAGRGSQNNQG